MQHTWSAEKPLLRLWALSFGVATFLGVASGAFVYFGMLSVDHPIAFPQALREGFTDWYFWALLCPLVFLIAWRLPIDRRRWLVAAALHLVVGSIVAVLEIGITAWVTQWLAPEPGVGFGTLYHRLVLREFHFAFMIYWVLVAAAHAFVYHRDAQEAAELRGQLSQAQLEMLQMQLHPHFLFNTLHTIATLMRARDTDTAVDMLGGLGTLLRKSLGPVGRNEVTLREELALLQLYLDIEQRRFQDRLRVEMTVADELLGALVPNLILQPLVENAIRHGVARVTGSGLVEIVATRDDAALCIEVRDDGPGFGTASVTDGHRVGLANARTRLTRLYGTAHRFEIGNRVGGGALVQLRIPWHTAPVTPGMPNVRSHA
jgi:two-component system, LytTR family, sensor kinase